MRSTPTLKLALFSIVSILAVGCGSSDAPSLFPVTGTVTYQGGPVAGARVTFIPDGKGAIAMATTDTTGKFTMKTGTLPGVVAGTCKVTVALNDSAEGGLNKNMSPEDMQKLQMDGKLEDMLKKAEKGSLLPPEYGKVDSTPLSFEIKKSSNDIPIELK